MDISKYRFSKEEIESLQLRRDNQPDARFKSRFFALLMVDQHTAEPKISMALTL